MILQGPGAKFYQVGKRVESFGRADELRTIFKRLLVRDLLLQRRVKQLVDSYTVSGSCRSTPNRVPERDGKASRGFFTRTSPNEVTICR